MPKRGKRRGSEILEVVQVHPVVGTSTGEIAVAITNPTEDARRGVRLRVRETTGGRGRGGNRFAVIPAEEDGGYRIDEVPAGATVTRSFSLRPLRAEIGSITDFEAIAELAAPEHGERAAPGAAQSVAFAVEIEARSESYATIGAVEWVRERLLALYDELEERGRRTQRERGLRWPAAEGDPARVVLGEKSFQAVFEVVELGARIASRLGKASRRGGD